MRYFHKLANPNGIEINEHQNAFLRELNHKFGLFVYRQDESNKFSMVTDIGRLYGMAWVSMSGENEDKPDYHFISEHIQKERGRGNNAHVRSSTSIKRLVKTLEKDFASVVKTTPDFVQHLWVTVQENIKDVTKYSSYESTQINRTEAERALLELFFDKKPITDNQVLEVLAKSKKAYDTYDQRREAYEEEIKPFSKCYVLCGGRDMPPMFGIATLNEKNKYVFEEGVNCYSSLEELPTEFAVAYKMWKIGTENRGVTFQLLENEPNYPMAECLPADDEFYSDFGVNTLIRYSSAYRATSYIFMVPYAEQTQA